ncbi:MAG: hypothetical protein ACXWCM_19735 [Acidimicrobiales bacterium]
MTFTCGDLEELAALVAEAWRLSADRDWSAAAGTLEWSCTRTADHAVDTVLAPAFFLASRKVDDYPVGGPFTLGPDARPDQLAEGVETAARILTGVVTAAPPDVRAIIWRRPRVEARPPEDFVPRGALELALHAHDVGCGLGAAFRPPAELSERLRAHTQGWPHWSSPGWTPLRMDGDPWLDLLRSSGRSSDGQEHRRQ